MTDPFVGKLTYFRVYSGKLNSGSYVYNTSTGRKERVGRILEMHANHREDVDQIGAGRDRRRRRAQADDHGRHAVRRGVAGAARVDRLPRPGDRRRRRAEDQGRPGQADPGAAAAGRGGPDLPRPHQRGDRPDHHRRHGRAAPGDHRRPPDARVQGGRQHRPAAGGLPRDDPPQGRERARPVRPPVRRPRPVRRRRDQPGAERAGRRVRVREQDRRRQDPARVHLVGRTPASARRPRPACWPGFPVVDVKVTLVDGSYHDVDSVGDGVQGRRIDGLQGRRAEGAARPCSSP